MAVRKPKALEAAELEALAAKLLQARALSTGELRERLRRRAANAADVEPILAKFRQLGFLNDRKFAEAFASARLESKGMGKARVLRDLLGRRVAGPLARKTVDAAFEGVEETALIEAFLARKFRHVDLAEFLAEEKNLAAAYRKLRYAGFSRGNSIRVLKQYSVRAEALEEAGEEPDSD